MEQVPSFQDQEVGRHLTGAEECERLLETFKNASKTKNPDKDYNPEDNMDTDNGDKIEDQDGDNIDDLDGDYTDDEDLNKNKPKGPVKNFKGKDSRENWRAGTRKGDEMVKAFLNSRGISKKEELVPGWKKKRQYFPPKAVYWQFKKD